MTCNGLYDHSQFDQYWKPLLERESYRANLMDEPDEWSKPNNTTTAIDKNQVMHETDFLPKVQESRYWVRYAVAWLKSVDCDDVEEIENEDAELYTDRLNHSDSGDLTIKSLIWDVKHIGIDSGHPVFKTRGPMIGAVRDLDGTMSRVELEGVILINEHGTEAWTFRVKDTRQHWARIDGTHPNRGTPDPSYCLKAKHMKYHRIDRDRVLEIMVEIYGPLSE